MFLELDFIDVLIHRAGDLLFGFAEENGGRHFIGGNVTKGQTVIIPQGTGTCTTA